MTRRRSFEIRERRRSEWTAELAERHKQLVAATVRLPAHELAELTAHLPDEVRVEVMGGRCAYWKGLQRFTLRGAR